MERKKSTAKHIHVTSLSFTKFYTRYRYWTFISSLSYICIYVLDDEAVGTRSARNKSNEVKVMQQLDNNCFVTFPSRIRQLHCRGSSVFTAVSIVSRTRTKALTLPILFNNIFGFLFRLAN